MIPKKLYRLLAEALLVSLPAIIVGIAWEVAVSHSQRAQFLFASPTSVVKRLADYVLNGPAITDTLVTASEAFGGFVMGNLLGLTIGIGLAYSPNAQRIAKWYIIALGAIPIFALAPMMIMWFGIGYMSKLMMAFFSTVLIAVGCAYTGATTGSDNNLRQLLKSLGASKSQEFSKIVLPSSLSWIVASFRLTVSFALLGAFIGEFVSAERGLGYRILRFGGVYDTPGVIAGILLIILLAIILNQFVDLLGKLLLGKAHSRHIRI